MTLTQGLILAVVVIVVGWIILQPQRWGKRDGSGGDSGTAIGVDGTGRRSYRDNDSDGDGGGDGGGGD